MQELTEQFSKLKTWLTQHKEKVGKMNGGIKTFVSETQSSFQGEAGDGMRACMTDVFTPLYAQFEVTEHTLNRAVDTISQKAESYFGGSGIVDSDYLDEWLNQVERIVRDFDHMSDDIDSRVQNINDLISVQTINRDPFQEPLYTVKRHVAEIKSHMTEFEAEANRLVSEVNMEVSKLTSMLKDVSRLNNDMRAYKSGSFKFNTLSMQKSNTSVYPLTMDDLNTSEVDYVKNLEKQFGFSEEEALLMLGVYRGLKNKYPSESEKDIGRRFSRLMSQSTYGGGQWDLLAGSGNLREEMESMGFPKEECQFLEDTIHMNYRGTSDEKGAMESNTQEQIERLRSRYPGMSNQEIADMYRKRFHDKNDFAHQMIVTAVDLQYPFGPDSNPAGTSGYIGDIRGVWATKEQKNKGMDNPDYKADLDGYNIAVDQRTDSNKSFLDVSNDYYKRIDPDTQVKGHGKTRATEFLYHKGYEDERKYGAFGNYKKSYEDFVNQGIGRVEWEINRNGYKENWGETGESKKFMDAIKNHQNDYR